MGARYRVAAVQREFDAELPGDIDGRDATGTGPLAGFGADIDARLTTRNVILARRGSGVKLGRVRTSRYKTRFEANVGGIAIPVDRGWASVEARLRGSRLRFVETHLEAYGDTAIREAQARELTAGPLETGKQLILVGDLNSGIARHNEPEKPGDDLAFRALADFGMNDKARSRAAATTASSTRTRSSTTPSTTSSPSRGSTRCGRSSPATIQRSGPLQGYGRPITAGS